VARLCVSAQQILAEIQKRPQRMDMARGFLTYYLEAAVRIVTGYEQLASQGSASSEVRRTMDQAEASLPGIQRAFDAQLESLMQLELLDLDSEIALLDKTVQMEERFAATRPSSPSEQGRTGPGAGVTSDAGPSAAAGAR
jgi:5-bromo-4-chloroindolyl phosphate hydrolysis protein